jgi:hypothetical protein
VAVARTLDLSLAMRGIDEALARHDEPLHREILDALRLHVMLESSGRYDEMFTRHNVSPDAVYRLTFRAQTVEVHGEEEIKRFYRAQVEGRGTVFLWQDDVIAVEDWGFVRAGWSLGLAPGWYLAQSDPDFVPDDPEAVYLARFFAMTSWPYENGWFTGEHFVDRPGTLTYEKLDPSEVITPEEAAAYWDERIPPHP